jgi:hypothetical protein
MWSAASPPALVPVINARRGSRDTGQRARTHGTTSSPTKSTNHARFARSSSRAAPDPLSISTAINGGHRAHREQRVEHVRQGDRVDIVAAVERHDHAEAAVARGAGRRVDPDAAVLPLVAARDRVLLHGSGARICRGRDRSVRQQRGERGERDDRRRAARVTGARSRNRRYTGTASPFLKILDHEEQHAKISPARTASRAAIDALTWAQAQARVPASGGSPLGS